MSLFILLPMIFSAPLVLTMVGLGGGLIFSPLFILLQFPVHTAVSASLFLNGIAAIAGGQVGSRIMVEKLKGPRIRKIFGGILLVSVLKLLQRVFM